MREGARKNFIVGHFLGGFLLLTSLASFAQPPNSQENSWVSYNHRYYKISVATTGIYRLTYDQLQLAGVPVNTIDPRLLQIFHRGVEQAIHFKHDQTPPDSKFDSGEYLEFYGQRNDGELDSKLYIPASGQPHKYFNLFSDTSAYFLTVNPSLVQGKRMNLFDQVNASGIPKETSQNAERLMVYTAEFSAGNTTKEVIAQSCFDDGEGWTGATICTVNAQCIGIEQRDFPIDQVTNTITSQSPPTLEIQLTGRDAIQHRAEIYAGPSTASVQLVKTVDFDFYQTPIVTAPLDWSYIGADGRVVIKVKAIGVGGFRDRLSVAYIKINFAQGFNMGSASSRTMTLNAKTGDPRSYIEIESAPAGTRLWDITDPSEIIQIGTRISGGLLTAVVGNTAQQRKIYAASTFIVPTVGQIKPVMFRELRTSAKFIIISHKSLMMPGLEYSNPVKAFAEYRASTEGGSYDTLMVDVDQLYDQFNYGENSPTAIYEFMRYMIAGGDPEYLFLIGKGRDVTSGIHRRIPAANEYKDLVPTGGHPGSDMMFTAGMSGEAFVPAVATGRLTASTPNEVAAYLNKVKQSEAVAFDNLWRKRILHLSGGIRSGELSLFKGYMQGFADIARGDYLGAQVSTLGKHGTADVEFINISKEINSGVGLVTFFGHSSSTATDIDIGFASQPIMGYNNPGKYPVFLVNGCNAGEFFNNQVNFAEDWVLAEGKGAKNFIANSSFGYDTDLRQYTDYFYRIGFGDSLFLAKGIGDVQKAVASKYLQDFGSEKSVYTAQVLQMMLLGDPSLRMFGAVKPDYSTNDAAASVVSFDNRPIHALSDSLQLRFITANLGRGTKRPLKVRILHTINDVLHEYDTTYSSVLHQDTLKYSIRRGSRNFYGNNSIEVVIDPDNKIDELNEANNKAHWTRFIVFNGTQNLQPPDFGIVTSTTLDALFQDTDVLSGQKSYQTQLDTTLLFNSPFMQAKTIQGKILLKARFNLLGKDSTVYYWRSKPADKPDDQWETTSFSYIKNGPKGWAQMAFDQMMENGLVGLNKVEDKKKLEFQKTGTSFLVKTFGSANTTPGNSISFQVDNAEYYYSPQGFNCRDNTVNLVAFDRSSVVPYLAVPTKACGREPTLINSFTVAETQTGNNDDLIKYVDNLKVNDSVVVFSAGDAGFALWPSAVKAKMGEIGLRESDIDSFLPGEPIIILGRKGAAVGSARIIRSDQPQPEQQELQVTEEITGYVSKGSIRSVVIGPSLKWNSMSPKYQIPDASDEVGIDVYTVARNGDETLLFFDQKTTLSLNSINASTHPFIRLVYRVSDPESLTPATLKHWVVDFDPAPDGILIPDGPTVQQSVPEGQSYTTRLAFVNITDVDFTDSLATSFSVVNRTTREKETRLFKIDGPAGGDTTRFTRTISTVGKAGLNDISAVVNNSSVSEQYYQNNAVELPEHLKVIKDQINPILDVTVDGRYVINGDFISANPKISINVRDENPLLVLSDTTALTVWLTYPCASAQCTPRRINFSSADMKWSAPASGTLAVEFTPKNLAAGEYVLTVEAKDRSGNPHGPEPYRVSFVVDQEDGMIFYAPYPNPSTAAFYFEFTSVGAAAPQSYTLQIIDRSGRDVARFTEGDSPALRVGMNQLRWSGVDNNGSRLSDGLYYYLLTVRSGDFEFKDSGRLVIMK